jgi:hypothetical protein
VTTLGCLVRTLTQVIAEVTPQQHDPLRRSGIWLRRVTKMARAERWPDSHVTTDEAISIASDDHRPEALTATQTVQPAYLHQKPGARTHPCTAFDEAQSGERTEEQPRDDFGVRRKGDPQSCSRWPPWAHTFLRDGSQIKHVG